jgi:hypothetical protein
MGARGPVPKRSSQRRRHNKPATPVTKAAAAKKPPIPRADPNWHPAAKRFYRALAKSGQAKFYEPSDWQLAWLIAESLSRDLNPQFVGIPERTGEPVYAVVPLKGASLAAYLKAMSALLATEGDRRRMGLELERPGEGAGEEPDVPSLDDYRKRLAV